jgi:membrane protease YdiL (CAAX protease family)
MLHDPTLRPDSSLPPSDATLPPSALGEQPPPGRQPPPFSHRVVALVEVLICSDYPTQLATQVVLAAAFGMRAAADGSLHIRFVVALSLVDTTMLLALIVLFLRAHGERPHDIFLGRRSVAREAAHGVPLILVAIALGAAVLLSVQHFAPQLHTVEHNPLQALIRTPRDAWLFAMVVVVAGGVREEIQRAFLLHRFDVWLGGGRVGVVVTSAAFGFGHLVQGVDATLATGVLGAFWGIVYLRRRSVVAPMVSHAGFDLLQIAQFVGVGR